MHQEIERLDRQRAVGVSELERVRAEYARDVARLDEARREESRTRRALLCVLEDLGREHEAVGHARKQWLDTVDAVRMPMMVHDGDGRVVRANRAYADRAGMGFMEMIGRPYWECFPRREGPLPCCADFVTEGDAPPHKERSEEEFTLETGEIFVSRAFVVRDPAGHFVQALHLFEDVTERRCAEEQLRLMALVVENSPSVLFRWKPEEGWPVAYVSNNVSIWGYAVDDLTSGRLLFAKMVHPHDLDRIWREVEEYTRQGLRKFSREYRILTASGEVRWVDDRTVVERDPLGRVRYYQGIALDVTERKRAEEASRRANRALRTLSAGNGALVRAADEPALLAQMCRVITEVGSYYMVWVGYARQDAEKSVEIVACSGPEGALPRQARISWADNEFDRGMTGAAIRSGEPQLRRQQVREPGLAPYREGVLQSKAISLITLPLRCNAGQPFGALGIESTEPEAFDEEELDLLGELASNLAFGVAAIRTEEERRTAAEHLRKSLEDSTQAIAATVEMRDPYTAGHQRRVAQLAAAIAREIGFTEDRVHGLHLAGTVHDLGKISVPAEILSKPGRLNEFEFGLVKMHAQVGYEILKNVDFPWPIAQMVLQHHERLDGSGYPQGLKGDAMLPESRILAVADIVEAMSSHRPYRPGLGLESALAEIERNRGRYYDEQAVDVCLALFRENRFTFE